MARRSKTSFIEDLYFVASKLPWWLSVAIAVMLFLYLDSKAVMPVIDPKNPAAQVSGMMVYQFAYWLRYIIPPIFLLGAVASFFANFKRVALLNNVRYDTLPVQDVLASVSWREFEMLVGQFFREKGYKVSETADGADGGIDLRLTASDFKTYLVQCKHWKASKVPVTVVRELYGVMAAEQAAGAFVVTSGQFTDDAQAFADGKNIQLIDGRLLVGAIKGSMPKAPKPVISSVKAAISCPVCNSVMLLRTAKKGINAGNQFYGCSRYPNCKKTINI
jgi:restriction system protein